FIEELVNMLQQKKLVHRLNGIIDFTSPDKLEEVPGSLRDSLQQKLDTLTYAKETGQLAATMGREFNYDLLVATANCSEAQIQTDLEELIEAELVYLQRRVSGDSYLFKHALVRDAAYESMGKEQREEAHKNIALVTEKQFPALAENNPADVARHYAGATMYHKAAEFGTKAIDKQVESSANDEAIAIGDTTLKWAAKMDDTVVKHQAQLNIHSAMLPAVMTLFGYGAKRVEDWGGIVQSLTRQLKDEVLDADELEAIDAMHKKSQWTLFIAAHYCSRRKEAREIGQKLLDKARKAQNRQDEMVVLVHLGQACNIDGDLVESMQTYEKALALYDETVDGPMALEYGMDLRVQALSLCSYNYIHFGQLAKAKDYAYQALSYAEHIGNIGEIVFANIFVALYHIFLKEFDEVKQTWQAFNTKHADKGRIFHVCYFECYCYSALKEPELSAKALQPQLDSGQLFAVGYYVTHLAEAYLEQGDVALATELMETSLQRSEKNGEASVWPFLKKTLAQCYYASDQQLTPRVEQLLVSSLQDAVDQKARYFEWENSVYYAQLLDKTGRDSCAVKANISSLYQWFYDNKEGTDTPLYRKTRQLMNLD
ncbi:MAG: tetratricopeptide (TPR) repeat protein, partial [Phenylobacterium sp.]